MQDTNGIYLAGQRLATWDDTKSLENRVEFLEDIVKKLLNQDTGNTLPQGLHGD